jgi:hypothetical protein
MMAMLDAHHERIMALLGSQRKWNLRECQEIPKEDAALMSVGELRKRRRVRNLAADHHQKMEERTWGYCGSRRKSSAAYKRVYLRAKVA